MRARPPRPFALIVALGLLGAWETAGADVVRFQIQPDASELTFKATSWLVNASGRFHRFAGEIVADPKDLSSARVKVSVEAASIDTKIARRDTHLRSADFLDVEKHPTISFEATRVEPGAKRITGKLTMHGVTREVTVPLTVELNDGVLTARGQFIVNRFDYDVSYQSRINPVGENVNIAFVFRARPPN
jgi:polyisoprenoid-binding protein YceI